MLFSLGKNLKLENKVVLKASYRRKVKSNLNRTGLTLSLLRLHKKSFILQEMDTVDFSTSFVFNVCFHLYLG